MLLHIERVGSRWVHGNAVDAVADFGNWVGDVQRSKATVDRRPRFAAIICAECASRRNGDEDAIRIRAVEQDGVKAHAAGAGRPLGTGAVAAETGEFVPGGAAVGGFEKGGVFDAGVDCVWFSERRLKMPDAFEFPGVLRAI